MAQPRSAAKVGAVVVMAATILGGVVYFFKGLGTGGYPVDVTFKDAQGIREQADVLFAGVKVGSVQSPIEVAPNGQNALLHLRINDSVNIPDNATFTITSGGLIGENFVQIMPAQQGAPAAGYLVKNDQQPARVTGTDLPTFDQLKQQAAQLATGGEDVMKNLQAMTANLARLSGDPALQNALRRTAGNVDRTSAQAALTAQRVSTLIDQQLPALRGLLATAQTTGANVEQASENARLAARNVEVASRQAPLAARNANSLVASANTLVRGLDETNRFLRDTIADTVNEAAPGPALKTTLANLAEASEQFKVIAADARKITNDLAGSGQASSNLGQTVTAVRDAATQASALLDKVTGVADRAGRRRGPRVRVDPQFEVFQSLNDNTRFRADVNVALPRGDDSAIVLGLYDIGEGNKLNLQNSVAVNPRSHFRYGFRASRLGVGLDYSILGRSPAPSVANPPGGNSLSLDFYSPNNPQLDVFGRQQINEKLGVTYGFEDVLHNSRATLGLTYRP